MADACGKLTPDDLMTLERYTRERAAFRAEVLAHKRTAQVAVGPNMTWVFEDRLTIQYQVQEMLRVERIFESGGIAEELEAYNPLIPDGSNWKATMMIEYPDAAERAAALERLRASRTGARSRSPATGACCAIADEDLERENDEKTSAVHFLRFELDARDARRAASAARRSKLGVDHQHYRHELDGSAGDGRDRSRRSRLSVDHGARRARARMRQSRRRSRELAHCARGGAAMASRTPPPTSKS